MDKRTFILAIIKKYELLLASGLIIILLIILAINFMLPNFQRAKLIFSQKLTLQQRYEKLTHKDKALLEMDAKFLQETYPKISWILPEYKDFVSLFSAFDLLQEKTGVTILRTNFQFGTISTRSASLIRSFGIESFTVPLTIEVAGNMSQLQKFQEMVANLSGRLIILDNSQWTFKKNNIAVRFDGRAFFYPVSAEIGAIDSPLPSLSKEKEEILKKIAQNIHIESIEEDQKRISSGKSNLFQ
ncbi:hypothetical protein FJY90_05595 [Candidatus Gottesmanbacteria bacterium]|nr:hypothetical protein [Candidatus Gottesmanbacteria bacterium]